MMKSKHKMKHKIPVRMEVRKAARLPLATSKIIIILIGIVIISGSVIFAINYPMDYYQSISGPWGVLELDPIVITPPANFANTLAAYLEPSKHWVFRNLTLDQIRTAFLDAGVHTEVCKKLLQYTKPLPGENGFVTSPPDKILWGFTPEMREKLYPFIGRSGNNKENSPYFVPYHFDSNNPNEWFHDSRLPKSLQTKLYRLVYHLNDTCCISDLHLLIPFVKNKTQMNDLMQIIFRSKAYTVYLRIKEHEDISKLVDYWGDFGRAQTISPLFESLRDNANGGRIDIINILPPMPRIRLNTYVNPSEYQKNIRDCNWAAFNFFNDQSDERVNDSSQKPLLFKKLARPLTPGDSPKFGDLVLIKTERNYVLHSCVYIADNLVYTKNGFSPHAPFILTTLDNVMSFYRFYGGTKTSIYSRNVADTREITL